MKKLDALLEKYGGLDFDKVVFFPGAPRTTPFGHDNTFKVYRWHNAVDRSRPGVKIRTPFDVERLELCRRVQSFGALLRLWCPEIEAEIRIAHLDSSTLSLDVEALTKSGEGVKAGTVIGPQGGVGLGTGPHIHGETVSFGFSSAVLDELLERKVGEVRAAEVLGEASVRIFAQREGMDEIETVEQWEQEMRRRHVISAGPHRCLRRDYLDGQVKTFYDSWELFGF